MASPSEPSGPGFWECIRAFENEWRGLLTALAVIIGGVGGGGWAILQSIADHKSQRVERTISYIERYQSGDVSQSLDRIFMAQQKLRRDLKHEPSPDGDERGRYLETLETRIEDGEINGNDINKVISFYENLFLCQDKEICDFETALSFFGGDESCSFYSNFAQYIETRKPRNKDLARGLKWFAEHGEPAKPCA